MFIPLYDGCPLRHIPRPVATWTLMAANILCYILFQSGFVLDGYDISVVSFGLIPAVLFETAQLPSGYEHIPPTLTLLTSQFLHGDMLHLGANMLFLWVFGDNVEDATGHMRFAVFYLLCGAVAGAAHAFLVPDSVVPMVGASGAVAGVIAAYLMLHPRVKLWVLAFGRIPIRLSAMWVLGAWIAYQIFNALIADDDIVAWWAHIGGFAAGAALIPLFKAPYAQLFDRGIATG